MDTNVNYTIVGAFMILLVSAIILAVIWLSSGFSLAQYTNYLVYMQESVSGLSIDSPVEYNGVNVGTVKSISLDKRDPHLVELVLNINVTTPITRGTVAILTSRGITGVAYIALKDTGTDLRPLLVTKDHPYPVIPTAPSIFTRLDIALKRLSNNIQTVADSLQSLLDKENLKSIKNILANLSAVTGTLSSNSEKLTTILINTSRASAQLTPLLSSSTATMRMIQTQTLPTTYHLLNNLDEVSRTLSQVSIQLKQNPSILIRGAAPGAPGPGEKR